MDNSYAGGEVAYGRRVHWDRLFENLEGQLAAEWECERAALDAESERLRISRLELRNRLRMLCADSTPATLDLPGHRIRTRLESLGADWVAAVMTDGEASSSRAVRIIPLHAIMGLSVDHGQLLASLDESDSPTPTLRERMTLGFLLRDFARRRVPVRIIILDGSDLHGTVDRAGADHLDLALHDPGTARLAGAVRSFRMLPFAAVASIQIAGAQMP